MTDAAEKPSEPMTGLDLLRAPFPDHQISKLPKETKRQTEQRKADMDAGRWPDKCGVCGGLHHKNAVHLDYVGHAALTDRLLDADPAWSWEPAALRDGLPAFDGSGGLWIKLTVCGVTRLGYGYAAAKLGMDPGSREKEVIGDALRNAAMRFGAALDLWHKGDLHAPAETEEAEAKSDLAPAGAALKEGRMAAEQGSAALAAWWGRLSPADKAAFANIKDAELKPMAAVADAEAKASTPFDDEQKEAA